MQPIIVYLEPWEFSPAVLITCILLIVAYVRGLVLTKHAGEAAGFWRPPSFFVGLGLIYHVYGICGRAWAINPMTDQQVIGLLT